MSQDVITSAAQEAAHLGEPTPVELKTEVKKSPVVKPKGFATLSVPELLEVAAEFGVEVPEKANKPLIIGSLAEEGVTFEQYTMFRDATKEEPSDLLDDEVEPKEDFVEVPVKAIKRRRSSSNDVLVKMERANYRFEIQGHTFTKEHPFVVMSADEYQEIMDAVPGFRQATPKEASDYYS